MGDQWDKAAEYSRYLAFYAAGLTMRGLVNIFHINEFKSKRLYQMNVMYFISVFGLMIATSFCFGYDALTFVQIFSFSTFFFWLIILNYSLSVFTKSIKDAMRTIINLLLLTTTFISIGLFLRSTLNVAFLHPILQSMFIYTFEFIEAIFVGTIALLATIITYYIIDPSGFKRQLQLVLSRAR